MRRRDAVKVHHPGAASVIPSALVTGTSSGIGRAVAERLLAGGWTVRGVDRQADPFPGRDAYRHFQVDLSELSNIRRTAAVAAASPVTAFVHAAGLMRDDSDRQTSSTAGTRLWLLHTGAAGTIAAALAPGMPDGRGRILFVSSRAADGRSGRSFYAASKAALRGLARSMASELATRGITVNVVAPAAVDTPQLRDPGRARAGVRALPIGRLIQPNEIAATVAFLLGPEAGAITGQTIVQCGGASLGGLPSAQPEAKPENACRDT